MSAVTELDMKTTKRHVASVAVVFALSIFAAPTAKAFKQGGFTGIEGAVFEPLANIPPNHQLITEEGLRSGAHQILPNWNDVYFSSSAMGDIMLANARTDLENFKDPTFHFDADNFEKSSEHLRSWHRVAAAYAVKGEVAQAREVLGLALHLLQDFYAHSNFVEIKASDPNLMRPKFGTERPFDGIGLPAERSQTGLLSAACSKTAILDSAPLTTGYYDGGQSGPDSSKAYYAALSLELTSPPGSLLFLAGQHYRRYFEDLLTADTAYRPLAIVLDKDFVHGLGAYTDEWSEVRQRYGSSLWPSQRCIHGDDEGPGLNHDKQGRHNYDFARLEAVKATREYFDLFFDRMVEEASKGDGPYRYRGICKFFGVEEAKCDLENVGIDSLKADRIVVKQGEFVFVTVTGQNIPTTAVVRMEDAYGCGFKSDASATGFTMMCRPGGNPGLKTISIALTANGEARSLTTKVTLAPAGLITFLPAELSGDSISSWSIKDLASWVKQVVWKFGSDAADVVVNIQNGVIDTAKTLLTLPGVREVVAILSGGFGDEGVTLTTSVNVAQGATVTSFEALGPVVAGQPAAFLLKGTKLPAGLVVSIQNCGIATETAQGGTDTQRQFACTFPASAVAGSKSVGVGPVGSQGTPFEQALASGFAINLVVKATVTRVTASPAPMPGAASVVAVIGESLPNTAVVLVDDATCDRATVIAKPDGTGFTQSCTFGPTAGTKGVIVMSASDASGFVIDDSKTLTVGAAQPSSAVADTGVSSCTDYAFSPFSLDHTVGLDCALTQDPKGDPVPPRQDGAIGRDALAAKGLLEKIGSGPGGFDFTKLDASGAALPASATNWACVRDNHTKLVWENKASDGGLRDHRHRYTWYSTAANENGGFAGSLGSNTCGGTLGTACNTQAYVAALNAAQLCGGSGWRLPKLEELRSIANFGRVNPSIDAAWFSNTAFIPSVPGGSAVGFWSSNVYSANPVFGVMGMEFSYGLLMTPNKTSHLAARAVMTDK